MGHVLRVMREDSYDKIIAMYLPQYHETEDNNKWWGKGFTDWISVKNSEKLFVGHRQPREPLGDRYYDLSDVDNIRWQVDLAKNMEYMGLESITIGFPVRSRH